MDSPTATARITRHLRAIRVVDAAGGTNIYMLRNYSAFVHQPPVPNVHRRRCLTAGACKYRDSFHWGPRQAAGLPVDMTNYAASDYVKARLRHWLSRHHQLQQRARSSARRSAWRSSPAPTASTRARPPGTATTAWTAPITRAPTRCPLSSAASCPDTTTWYADYQRDAWGRATNVTDTYSTGYGANAPDPHPAVRL